MPTTDLRSIFKGVLADHLSVPKTKLDSDIFPGSKDAPATQDLCTARSSSNSVEMRYS